MTVGIVLGEVLLGFWKRVVCVMQVQCRRSVFVVDYSQKKESEKSGLRDLPP